MREVDVYLYWLWSAGASLPLLFVGAWVMVSLACLMSAPLANLLIYIFWSISDMIIYSRRGFTTND